MAVLFALLGAASYGLSDFVGGLVSRRVPGYSVAWLAQVGGLLAILSLLPFVAGSPSGADLGWAALAGIGNAVGTVFVFRGLATGRMGVVAPVSGVVAALLPVLVGFLLGERVGLLVWTGIVAALPGIWLVAREPRNAARPAPAGVDRAAVDGAVAGSGFGLLLVSLSRVGEDAGMTPLAVTFAVGTVTVALIAAALSGTWLPRQRASSLGLVSGVLAAAAAALFVLAERLGYLTVTAVVISLYPAFTVLLAAVFLRERIIRPQGVGLALCALAVALVAAG